MKKILLTVMTITFVCFGIYAYDVYSGYTLTKLVNSKLYNEPASISLTDKGDTEDDEASQSLNSYFYSQLDDGEKIIYDRIYNGISAHKTTIPLSLKNDDGTQRAFDIFSMVLAEHPEFFWVSSSASYSAAGYMTIEYIYTTAQSFEKQKQIEEKADEIIGSLSADSYEKSVVIFDWIIGNTEYDFDNMNDVGSHPSISTIEGVFLNGKAICSGYAKAYQYLLQRAGIGALYISGKVMSDNEWTGHAWVCQQFNNDYAFTDPTWCDCFEDVTVGNFISHTYFCVSDDELSATHKKAGQYENLTANCSDYGYYQKNGLYFDEYNAKRIRNAIINQMDEEATGIEFKFSNNEAYLEAVNRLFDNYEIHIILSSIDLFSVKINTQTIGYSCDDKHRVIAIIFEKI